jgi:hypothetical protein
VTFSSSLFGAAGTAPGVSVVSGALAARVLGSGLATQPDPTSVTNELNAMIGRLCQSTACTTQARVMTVTSAACAAAFSSADMLIN